MGVIPIARKSRGKYRRDIMGGRSITARPSDPKDQQRFAYPVYVVFLLAPTIGVSLSPATNRILLVAMDSQRGQCAGCGCGCCDGSQADHAADLMILTLSTFGVVQGSKLQQLSLLVGFLLAAGTLLLVRGNYFVAGLCLPWPRSSRN